MSETMGESLVIDLTPRPLPTVQRAVWSASSEQGLPVDDNGDCAQRLAGEWSDVACRRCFDVHRQSHR
jgi:hypothetical protein